MEDPIMVMDKDGFHHMDVILEVMKILVLDHYALPPCSPYFNPIENLVSYWEY